ncbi:MAG: SpoIIE family protein phosphatase [Flavobacteriales bacterium]
MRSYNIVGLVAVSLLFIGTFLKAFHWFGAGIAYVLTMFTLVSFFAPLRLMDSLKSGRSKLISWVEYFTITLLSIATVFKMMHWPFGGFLLYTFFFVFFLGYVPTYVIQGFRQSADRNTIYFNMIIGGIVIMMFYLYMGGQVSARMLDSYDLALTKQVQLFEKSEKKANKLMESISLLNVDSINHKSSQLHARTNEIIQSIDTLTNFLIAQSDGISIEKADSLWFGHIQNRDKFDIPTQLLMFEGRGEQLRKTLNEYSEWSKKLFDPEVRLLLEEELSIDTKDRYDEWNEENITWERYMFDHVPLSVVIGSMLTVRHEVIQVEIAALEEMLNAAASEKPDNFAAILAEVNSKYEAEARQLEIAELEKQKELSDESVKSKQEEVDAIASTMLWMGLGIFIFIVMLFYVIRSNIARKRLNKEITQQKIEIEHQKELVEEKNREVTESITYAKRIQEAILPPRKLVKEYLSNSFVLYKPKDIVAGDFYWMQPFGDWVFFAAADCTGHGVPGAMVSVICNNGLNRSVREFGLRDPAQILDKTRDLVMQEFEKSEEDVKDGMDIALCALNTDTNELHYAGAQNPLWIVRSGASEVEEIKGDKQPIGRYAEPRPFTTHHVKLEKGDTIYVFSDGYADQFGGVKGKKFKYASFKELLVSIQEKPMEAQREIINSRFEEWRGELEQIDDVCVIGVRI